MAFTRPTCQTPLLPDVPEIRKDLANYLGEVAVLDSSIGAFINELKKSGKFDKTLIAFSATQSARLPNGKCNLQTSAQALPFHHQPGREKGGRMVDGFFLF